MNFDNNMIRYINDRFIDIQITTSKENGLSIPASAIIQKAFYLIPIDYIFTDSSTGNTYLMKET